MRIVGEIPHPYLKITVLHMNDKFTIQFEDGLLSQSYALRSGSGIEDMASITEFVDQEFIQKVMKTFQEMGKQFSERIRDYKDDQLNTFDII